jgi:hypothetical protein
MYTLQKPSPQSNHREVFRINIRIIFIISAVDVELHLHLARDHQATSNAKILLGHAARLTVVDEIDENRSVSEPLQLATAPKTISPWGRTTPHAAIVRSGRPRSRVSLGTARTKRRESTATKKLLDHASMEGMTLRAPPSTDLRI